MGALLLDVIIKGQSLWPTFLVGLGGALIGALAVFGVELWRQVLEFRSAARVVEYELKANLNRCTLAISARRGDIDLLDEAWHDYRIKLAPLLPTEVYLAISTSYDAFFVLRHWISKLPTDEYAAAKREVEDWIGRAQLHPAVLIQIQRRKRASQVFDALFSRATWAPPVSPDKRGGSKAGETHRREA